MTLPSPGSRVIDIVRLPVIPSAQVTSCRPGVTLKPEMGVVPGGLAVDEHLGGRVAEDVEGGEVVGLVLRRVVRVGGRLRSRLRVAGAASGGEGDPGADSGGAEGAERGGGEGGEFHGGASVVPGAGGGGFPLGSPLRGLGSLPWVPPLFADAAVRLRRFLEDGLFEAAHARPHVLAQLVADVVEVGAHLDAEAAQLAPQLGLPGLQRQHVLMQHVEPGIGGRDLALIPVISPRIP